MNFCPECWSLLEKVTYVWQCPRCEFTECEETLADITCILKE